MDIENIKKAITVTDSHILSHNSIEITKYGKTIKIVPVNWFNDWPKFSYSLGIFLNYYYIVCSHSKLPDNLNELNEFKDNIKLTIAHKQAWKMMCEICKFSGFKLKWMKNNFNIDDWIEIFIYVFFSNVILTQRDLESALKNLGKAQ